MRDFHSRPHTWYASGRRGGVSEAPTSGESDEIIARYVNQAREYAALLGLAKQHYSSVMRCSAVPARVRWGTDGSWRECL